MKKWQKAASLVTLIVFASLLIFAFLKYIKTQYLQTSFSSYTQTSEGKQEDNTVLRFSWWGGSSRNNATLDAINAYSEANPDVEILSEFQSYEGYHDKISVQLSTAQAPDIFQFNPENLSAVVERGQVISLEKFVQEGILDISNIPEANLLDGKYNGQLYGIPMSIQTFCIIYNKYLFDLANVKYPSNNWTWEDYEATLRALKNGLPQDVYPSCDLRSADLGLLLMVHQQGASYFSKTGHLNFKDEMRKPLELFQKFTNEGFIPSSSLVGGISNDALFVSERTAMNITLNAMAQTLQAQAINQHEFGLAAIPSSAEGEKLGTYVKGDLLFLINANSPHQREAVKFLNALINDEELIRIQGITRGLPPSLTAQAILESDDNLTKDVFLLQRLAEQSNDIPEPRYFSGWSECVNAIATATMQYTFGKTSIDETIDNMVNNCENIISNSDRASN